MFRIWKDVNVSSLKRNGVRDPVVTSLTCFEQNNVGPLFFGIFALSFSVTINQQQQLMQLHKYCVNVMAASFIVKQAVVM
jgi:hypothetical protein